MPLYEYACTQCGKHVEKIQKFSDPPLTRCSECGGALKKVLSSAAIQFKGSGWYVTDYAPKHSAAAGATGAADGGDGDKGKPAEGAKKEVAGTKKEVAVAKK